MLGFQWIPFLRKERLFDLSHMYLPFRLVSPQALNHQPPAKICQKHLLKSDMMYILNRFPVRTIETGAPV